MSALDNILPPQKTQSGSALDIMFSDTPVYPQTTPDIPSPMGIGEKIKSAFTGGVESTKDYLQQGSSDTFTTKLKNLFYTPDLTVRNTFGTMGRSYIDSITQAHDQIANEIEKAMTQKTTTAEKISGGLNIGLGTANAFFAPITALLSGLEKSPIPGVQQTAKLINTTFGALGSFGSGAVGKMVDDSSFSPETKATIKQPLQELGGLIAQIVAGKAGEVTKTRVTQLTKQILETTKNDVVTRNVPVRDITGETRIPVSTPMSRLGEYSRKQGYEPYNLDRTLPVIEAGKATSELPVIQIGEKAPRVVPGDFTYEPIRPVEIPQVRPTVAEKVLPEQPFTTKPVTIKPERVTFQDGTRTTKVASDINREIVERGFKSLPLEEQSKYSSQSWNEQMREITSMLDTKFEQLKNIALGKERSNLNPSLVFETVSRKAKEANNIELLMDLAKSPYGTKQSEAGQILGATGFARKGQGISVVGVIRDIQQARREALGKKVNVKTEAKKIDTQIKAYTPKVTKQTWSQFIEEIKC